MTDLGRKDAASPVQIVGKDENYMMDVELIDGKRRALTSSIVIIEQLFGRDNYADTWYYIGDQYDSTGAGGVGDTVRLQIGQGPDASYEAIDLTYTLIAEDVGDELKLTENLVRFYNTDTTFRDKWKASRVKDNSVVHIGAKIVAEFGERINSGDFQVTSTGTTIVTRAWDKIERKGKSTSLTRDSRDPRVGILGISGEFILGVGDAEKTYNSNSSNGTTGNIGDTNHITPESFYIDADATEQIIVKELRLHGLDAGIKYGKFLGINSKLSYGLQIEVKTQNKVFSLAGLYSTDDLKSIFSSNNGWHLDIQSGGDHFLGVYEIPTPWILEPVGTYATDDYIKITVNDNLSGVDELYMTAVGFTREP